MIDKKLLIIPLIMLLILYRYRDIIFLHWTIFLTVQRGILSPNKFWYAVSDLYKDSYGISLYYNILRKEPAKIKEYRIFGRNIHIVADIEFIKQMLDQSPYVFGVGEFKYDFFKLFMSKNVGVSEGCPWKNRRELNEHVLTTNKIPIYNKVYRRYMRHILKTLPTDYDEFVNFGKVMTMKIVFGEDKIFEPIFELLKQANSFKSVLTGYSDMDSNLSKTVKQYYNKHIDKPNRDSLIHLTKKYAVSNEEIIHQIPHWIFPIAGAISMRGPMLLLLLYNHPDKLQKIKEKGYLRNCILESFRLNNPVNSTFRSLLTDYQFDDKHRYKKGTQFLIINNPVLRDPQKFKYPNRFMPERWIRQSHYDLKKESFAENKKLEDSYYNLTFNQGPQICPGKEFAINLLESFVMEYLKRTGYQIPKYEPKLNTEYIVQGINPFKIRFEY